MKSHDTDGPGPADASASMASRLIRHAARSAPATLSARLEEEWLADLMAQKGPLGRLLFALGCCWATQVIAREHLGTSTVASSVTAGGKTVTLHPGFSALPRHTSALVLVVCLHLLLLYAFASGLASRVMRMIPSPMQAVMLQQPRRPEAPPPPPAVASSFRMPQEQLPPPDTIVLPSEPGPPPHVIRAVAPLKAPQAPQAVTRVLGGPGAGFPATDDYYPPVAIRLGLQGTTAVQVCVDVKGRLTSQPRLYRSSGFATLDAGALKLARAGSGHYRPTTEDGRPVSACYAFRIRFHLTT